jgi:chemotaxis protein CheY-P-specific phosphatase CheC
MSDNARITAIFEALAEKLANGLSDLMGCSIEVSLISERRVSKADFFASFHKKLVMANMDVSGSRDGTMHCFCQLKDAVLLGGTLIMLPPAELEKQVRKEEFSEDEADAYGEIVNIVSGELCQAFDEMAVDKLHFKKTGIEVVVPAKVVVDAEEPFPPGEIYQVSFDLALEGQPLQTMEMVFPPVLLGLVSNDIPVSASVEKEDVATFSEPLGDSPAVGNDVADNMVLVVAGRKEDVHDLTDACIAEGFVPRVAGYQEDFQPFGPNGDTPVKGVVFTMDDSKELGLAAIIKAKAIFCGSVPLIAAGGQWTRSQVLQAVKYGVCDIVVMPASPDDIREKLRQNMGRKQS